MDRKSRPLAFSAVASALGVALLYLAALLPTGKLVLVAAAALNAVFLRLTFSGRWDLGCYLVTSSLGLLLLPVKIPALIYAAFLGYYPLLKLRFERIPSVFLRWTAKLCIFNAALIAVYFLALRLIGPGSSWLWQRPWIALIAANVVFFAYDYVLQQGMLYYLRKIARRI